MFLCPNIARRNSLFVLFDAAFCNVTEATAEYQAAATRNDGMAERRIA